MEIGMNASRTVLITGSASGIGRAIANYMAQQGYSIAMLDRSDSVESAAADVAKNGSPVSWAVADVGDFNQINDAVKYVRNALGPIDCLINNAGITNHVAPITSMTQAKWEKELSVNLSAPLYLIQSVLPDMVARKWGRIVNMASQAAQGGLMFQAGYSASKAGVLGLTRSVTLEYARNGITCNAILPGLIETEAVAKLPPVILNHALSLTPARRTGQPNEVAHLVAFLCSDLAGFVNGAEIDIDGGSHLCQMVLGSIKELEERSLLTLSHETYQDTNPQ